MNLFMFLFYLFMFTVGIVCLILPFILIPKLWAIVRLLKSFNRQAAVHTHIATKVSRE